MSKKTKNSIGNVGMEILPRDQVLAEIETIGKDSKAMGTRIQNAMIQSALHAHKHGDLTLLTALYQSLCTSQRKETLKQFIIAMFPVKYEVTDAKKNVAQFVMDSERDSWDFETAIKTPFHLWKEEKAPQQLTLAAILKMLERVVDKVDSAKDKGKTVDPAIESIANAVRGIVDSSTKEELESNPVKAEEEAQADSVATDAPALEEAA